MDGSSGGTELMQMLIVEGPEELRRELVGFLKQQKIDPKDQSAVYAAILEAGEINPRLKGVTAHFISVDTPVTAAELKSLIRHGSKSEFFPRKKV